MACDSYCYRNTRWEQNLLVILGLSMNYRCQLVQLLTYWHVRWWCIFTQFVVSGGKLIRSCNCRIKAEALNIDLKIQCNNATQLTKLFGCGHSHTRQSCIVFIKIAHIQDTKFEHSKYTKVSSCHYMWWMHSVAYKKWYYWHLYSPYEQNVSGWMVVLQFKHIIAATGTSFIAESSRE